MLFEEETRRMTQMKTMKFTSIAVTNQGINSEIIFPQLYLSLQEFLFVVVPILVAKHSAKRYSKQLYRVN
jgi:hypothetical protein